MRVSILLQEKENEVFTTVKECSVLECVQKMNQKRIGALVVVSENDVVEGIVTERDILRVIGEKKGSVSELKVSEVMTGKEKLIVAEKDELVEQVMEVMTGNRIRHLPVVENDKLLGIISIGDVVKHKMENALVENESMRNYIAGA